VERVEERECRPEVDLRPATMEGWVDECEVEAGIRWRLAGVPPDDLAAIAQTELLYVQSRALDRAGVGVREENLRFRPEPRGCDSQNTRAASEIDEAFRRLVSHEAGKRLEQQLTACVELLRAEYTRQGFEFELEALSVDGFDGGEKSRRVLAFRSGASVLLEANDARPRTIDDDDRGLVELRRKSLDRRDNAERVGAGEEKLAVGLQDTPCLLKIGKRGGPALLKMDEDLREALVCEITGRIDDVQAARLGGEKTIPPRLYDGPTLSDHRQIGLEFADAALTECSGIEGEGLGSSITSTCHGGNIVELPRRASQGPPHDSHAASDPLFVRPLRMV